MRSRPVSRGTAAAAHEQMSIGRKYLMSKPKGMKPLVPTHQKLKTSTASIFSEFQYENSVPSGARYEAMALCRGWRGRRGHEVGDTRGVRCGV